jgi:hypothetical protein
LPSFPQGSIFREESNVDFKVMIHLIREKATPQQISEMLETLGAYIKPILNSWSRLNGLEPA